jgi:hypothetical protein
MKKGPFSRDLLFYGFLGAVALFFKNPIQLTEGKPEIPKKYY